MKNWRRLFLGAVSSAMVVLPVLPVSAGSGQQQGTISEHQAKPGGSTKSSDTRHGQGSKGSGKGQSSKGKSATSEPAAGGPQGEDKAGGSGPTGPQALPPGGAPQFEGEKKAK